MAEEGVHDFRKAKLKARDRLKLSKDVPLPANHDVQLAMNDYLLLFTPEDHIQARRLRMMDMARDAMNFFRHYKPKLVADFLSHAVSKDAIIELHLQTQSPESVAHFLHEHDIPFEQQEKQIQFGTNDSTVVPVFKLLADNQPFNLIIFTEIQARQSPRNTITGIAQYRINAADINAWLKTNHSV